MKNAHVGEVSIQWALNKVTAEDIFWLHAIQMQAASEVARFQLSVCHLMSEVEDKDVSGSGNWGDKSWFSHPKPTEGAMWGCSRFFWHCGEGLSLPTPLPIHASKEKLPQPFFCCFFFLKTLHCKPWAYQKNEREKHDLLEAAFHFLRGTDVLL